MGKRAEQIFLQRRYANIQEVHENILSFIRHNGNANQNHKTSFLTRMAIVNEKVNKKSLARI